MLIGKPGPLKSGICTADEASITVRGRDLCNDLMGGMGSTEFFLLHLTGKPATPDQVFFMDAMLVGLAEHGLVPCVQAARMTLAAAPEEGDAHGHGECGGENVDRKARDHLIAPVRDAGETVHQRQYDRGHDRRRQSQPGRTGQHRDSRR